MGELSHSRTQQCAPAAAGVKTSLSFFCFGDVVKKIKQSISCLFVNTLYLCISCLIIEAIKTIYNLVEGHRSSPIIDHQNCDLPI